MGVGDGVHSGIDECGGARAEQDRSDVCLYDVDISGGKECSGQTGPTLEKYVRVLPQRLDYFVDVCRC